MIVKRGSVVSHTVVDSWGTGKVVEVAAAYATIQFSDGITRKIAASHFNILVTADPATFIATEASSTPAVKTPSSRARKPKQPKVTAKVC